jgi:hypothetical protein
MCGKSQQETAQKEQIRHFGPVQYKIRDFLGLSNGESHPQDGLSPPGKVALGALKPLKKEQKCCAWDS